MTRPVIVPLSENVAIDLSSFECEKKDMEEWIRTKAKQQDHDKISKIFVLLHENDVIGVSAIFCSTLRLQLPGMDREIPIPAICLGQLAVLSKYRKIGLGQKLIDHTISIARKIGNYSACRIVYLYAYPDVIDYYERLQFQETNKKVNDKIAMFFDLSSDMAKGS